jgi:molybdate transport system substrate-binding protein
MDKTQKFSVFLLGTLLFIAPSPGSTAEKLLLYAAASTYHAVSEIIKNFNNAQNEIRVKASFASSSTLAKQIQAGAPADLYISANPKWLDFLGHNRLIIPESQIDLLYNSIVLIAPVSSSMTVKLKKGFNFAAQLNGKLCLGDPDHVPAGIYAKQALTALNWWDTIKSSIVGTKDVRAALALVERGECAAGIVYTTDAKASQKITVLGQFPPRTHEPIVYPVARIASSSEEAATFITFLQSPQSRKVFKKHGFSTK